MASRPWAAALAATLLLVASPAAAAPADPATVLAPADATNAMLHAAQADLARAQTAQDRVQRALDGARARLAADVRAEAQLGATLIRAQADRARAAARLDLATRRLHRLAVDSYVAGGDPIPSIDVLLGRGAVDAALRKAVLSGAAARTQRRERVAATDALRVAREHVVHVHTSLDGIRSDRLAAETAVANGTTALTAAVAVVAERRQNLQLIQAAAPADGTGIPGLALDAYTRAAATQGHLDPACGLRWTALAALGRIESDHGRMQNARVSLAGDVVGPILGIPLDGTNGTALVPDTDHGVFDHDPVYDHAVGPMQFIPSTWARVAKDGNGDGVADANNLYDAAAGAADYLCRAAPPGGLRTTDALRQAFFSYNHAGWYAAEALVWTATYDLGRGADGPDPGPGPAV